MRDDRGHVVPGPDGLLLTAHLTPQSNLQGISAQVHGSRQLLGELSRGRTRLTVLFLPRLMSRQLSHPQRSGR
jgi:hypothetical protein